jgi:hypothetical protein
VHHILPKKGVKIATSRNNQIDHIIRTPRFRPDTFVPRVAVIMTIYINIIAKMVSIIWGHLDTTVFLKRTLLVKISW